MKIEGECLNRGRITIVSLKYDLQGHSALITGSGRRLGRAFAEAIASCGANVGVHYGQTVTGAEEVVESVRALGVEAVTLQADLSQPDQLVPLIERAVESLDKVNILVNNASIFEPNNFMETTQDSWNRHMAINLTAPFLLSQAFARHLDGEPGMIINLLDWRALRPGVDHFAYTITKAGLAAMTRSLAQSLAPSIRVNGLALGAILPPQDTDGQNDEFIKDVPAGRWGTVEETVDALLFLLAGSDFVTGEILHLDGGRHLK